MRTIAMLNQKGGVGKTTIAVNLAYALSLSDRKVLLVDLDPQSNATIALTPSKQAEGDIYKLLTSELEPKNCISVVTKNLHFISSTIDLAGIEHELTHDKMGILKEKFENIGNYDYVIFDCGPSLGLLVLSCLNYVNEVFIPIQPEFFALNGLSLLMKTVERVKTSLNPNIFITGIIFSLYEGRRIVTKEVEDEVSKYCGHIVFKTKIKKYVKVVESQSYGQSIFQYDNTSPAAGDFISLAKEVIEKEGVYFTK